MFRFSASVRTLGKAVTLQTPVQFDNRLFEHLLAEHRELNSRYARLVARIGSDPEGIERAVRECTEQLVELRRTEALWLYPVIARAIEDDIDAQQQFLQLRLVMLRLARRILRLLDDLAQAIRLNLGVNAAADLCAEALAEYWQRNRAQIYPLYDLIGTKRTAASDLRAG